MDYFVAVCIITGIFFFFYGLLLKNKPGFLSYLTRHRYKTSTLVRAHKTSSYITSISSFIIAYLIYNNGLKEVFFLLIVIIWSGTNYFLLRKKEII